jgi:predicted secreted protein
MTDVSVWVDRVRDQRGRRVIFCAHCLLNENTRYLGGACRRGAVAEFVRACVDDDLGIVQMPCPEEQAWGGVLKRRMLRFWGSDGTLRFRLRRLLMPVLLWSTRRAYRRLARQTARRILDYLESGATVAGVVGVDGSPSCGVATRLDLDAALEGVARLDRATATADAVNAVIVGAVTRGPGLYVERLQDELRRHGLVVPFAGHDLVAELEGRASAVNVAALAPQCVARRAVRE